jgi:type IV pilus assembly protein PilN
MRIRINLLPPEQRPPRWRYGRLLSLPVLLVLLIIAGIYGYREYRYWDLEQQLEAARSRYEALAAAEQQMRIAQTRQAAVQAREKILLDLSAGRNSWHGAMVHLGGFMPRKVWLTEIGSAQKGVLQLKGNALTYPELMAFLAKLEQDKLFTESILLKAENDSKESFTKFEITAKLGRQ